MEFKRQPGSGKIQSFIDAISDIYKEHENYRYYKKMFNDMSLIVCGKMAEKAIMLCQDKLEVLKNNKTIAGMERYSTGYRHALEDLCKEFQKEEFLELTSSEEYNDSWHSIH